MKENEKKGIIILVIIAVIIIAIVVFATRGKKQEKIDEQQEPVNQVTEEFVDVLNDGTKMNTSDKLKETKTIDGLEISNFQLTEKENVTQLLGTIKNNTNENKGGYPVNITVLDKEGNEIITVGGYIKELKPGETTQLSSSATFDYANAYDFKIERK